ncbi:hypothetical protein D9758_009661 [Tetrapyrgos nigripes]|uniref:Uncharacterized protein n=1 Tax=Tetrapyrgos nigripes TaxID=182062 RepID=A0A8H5CNW4_9AGAR|nr:hypothetical protein D9758_009661 [Tetrapyrgos nigripes]
MSGLKNLTFGNGNPFLNYTGTWMNGTWNASNGENTLHITNELTARVTFTFPVPANAFYYYGMKRSNGARYGICIDDPICDPASPIVVIDALDCSDDGHNPPVCTPPFTAIWISPTDDEHCTRLFFSPMNSNTRQPAGAVPQLVVDRFEIQVPTTSISAFTSSTIFSSSSSTTSASPSSSSSSQSTPVGTIAGGVIGGLTLIAIILCIRRRRNNTRRLKRDSEASAFPPNTTATPFSPYTLTTGTGGGRGKHCHTPTSTNAVGTGLASPIDIPAPGSRTHGRSGPRRSVDAGLIMEAGSEHDGSETLPPDYNQVFGRGRTGSRTASTQVLSQVQNPDDRDIDSGVSNAGARLAISLSQEAERRALPTIPQKQNM